MKERLTGAIILVALIVLLVPELLTGPVRSAPRAVAVASSPEEPPLRSYTIKLAEDGRPQVASADSGPEQPGPLAPPPEPSATLAPTALAVQERPNTRASSSTLASAPSAQPPSAAGAASAAPAAARAESSQTYSVQLGSFASRVNADRLARQVRAQGFTVSVSQGSAGHLYRVRVGPARDHAAALTLAQQLQTHGHSGAIVPQ